VVLKNAELNVERVRVRVEKGGHNVLSEKIMDRRRRSFSELPWFLAHADTADLDNSDEIPQLVASKSDDIVEIFDELAPELDQAIQRAAAGDLRNSARFLST
jgi:predicted ABC-type ATPase